MLLSFILKKNITLLNFKLALSSLKQVQYQTIQPWVLTNFFTTALPKFRLWCREETTIIIVFLLLFSHKSCLNVGNSGTAALQGSLSFTISQSLLRFMYPESVMLSKHLIRCCQLLWLLSNFPSIGVFSSELSLHIRWPKILELQLQHQSFQWIFRTDIL